MTSPAMRAFLDQDEALTKDMVMRYGWRIVYVYDDPGESGPTFAYTVGLFGLGHPELLVFDVPPELAAALLNDLATSVRDGENLLPRREIAWPRWDRRLITEQHPEPEMVVYEANRFYDRMPYDSVPVLQLTYSDDVGRFPWEAGYDGPQQPRPGSFVA